MHKTFSKTKIKCIQEGQHMATNTPKTKKRQTKTHTIKHTHKELLMRQSIKQANPNKQTNKQTNKKATKAWAMCLWYSQNVRKTRLVV